MANISDKSGDGEENQLRMDLLDRLIDQNERYRIMVEVFLSYIPENEKNIALAHVAERIFNEVKNCESIDE